MEKITIENLTFRYPGADTDALCGISLSISSGEFVTLCGKSGCGKTTLLRLLKPSVAPHGELGGKILYDGRQIDTLTPREQAESIGFVMQNPDSQLVCDKVWHELAFALENLGEPTEKIRARVAETAAFFGISDLFYKNTAELSGGQKQLVNLAATLVLAPKLLILDEPTAQLDPIAAYDFLQSLLRVKNELGVTVILCEHRLEDAFPLSDRVLVMEDGAVIADGAPRAVGDILTARASDMTAALPAPMRVYYSVKSPLPCPVTVGEGRAWLEKTAPENPRVPADAPQKHSETVLDVRGVWFRYERDGADIIKNLTFSARRGELLSIIGANGAGKSTALAVICGLLKPQRGSIKTADGLTIAMLAQNPADVFTEKTVRLDLYEMLPAGLSPDEKEAAIADTVSVCGIGALLERHPYDLSGGEQQRAAIAKILLRAPDILLLDEPTKGLCAHYKIRLAGLFKKLTDGGTTIITVSHDIEFCARHSDRVAMFFDGAVISEGTPRGFFAANSFYTTAASRMSRGILDGAVLCEDIISAIGGRLPDDVQNVPEPPAIPPEIPPPKPASKPKSLPRGIIFTALFLAVQYLTARFKESIPLPPAYLLSTVFAALALSGFLPAQLPHAPARKAAKKPRRGAAATPILLAAALVTVLCGVYLLGDRKYYIISLLIIAETLAAFFLSFERRRPDAREVIIIGVLCALAIAGRTLFAMLPQFKPVCAVVITAGVCFGSGAGFLTGAVSAFVSNFYFGQGPWTPWQMFSFGIIGALAGFLSDRGILPMRRLPLCIFGALACIFIYGAIMNPASVLMMHPTPDVRMLLASYIAGLPFDLVHAASTVFFLWFAAEPLCEKLGRVKIKYGLDT